jgi:nucleotide-binding universal stress UspA family protein
MSHRIQSILVGSSLSPASDGVVGDALALARALGATLRVVHGFSPPVGHATEAPPASWLDPDLLVRREQELRQTLTAQIERLGVRDEELAGLALGPLPAHRLLVDVAREVHADLIVVGAREHGRFLGSTAERVVRRAHTPVFIRRGPVQLPPQRVLLPVDLSERAAEAVRVGIELLAQLGERGGPWPQVEALFVLLDFVNQLAPQFTAAQVHGLAEQELRRFVEGAAGGRAVERRLRVGEVVPEILAEIDSLSADLVILGTHGRGGFERFLLGSVAEYLARAATCNVLIVPPANLHQAAAAA